MRISSVVQDAWTQTAAQQTSRYLNPLRFDVPIDESLKFASPQFRRLCGDEDDTSDSNGCEESVEYPGRLNTSLLETARGGLEYVAFQMSSVGRLLLG
jgi:hypothetical protein